MISLGKTGVPGSTLPLPPDGGMFIFNIRTPLQDLISMISGKGALAIFLRSFLGKGSMVPGDELKNALHRAIGQERGQIKDRYSHS